MRGRRLQVLQQLEQGEASADDISKTLRSFQVDITSNPSLAELLGHATTMADFVDQHMRDNRAEGFFVFENCSR